MLSSLSQSAAYAQFVSFLPKAFYYLRGSRRPVTAAGSQKTATLPCYEHGKVAVIVPKSVRLST